MDEKFSVGDLVWAKMKGYPPWPARIIDPDPEVKTPKKKSHFVFFFGTNDHAWIEINCLFEYEKNASKFAKNKTSAFREAVEAMEVYRTAVPPQGDENYNISTDVDIINSANQDLSHSAAAPGDAYEFEDGEEEEADAAETGAADKSFKSVKRKRSSAGGGGEGSRKRTASGSSSTSSTSTGGSSGSCVSVGSSDVEEEGEQDAGQEGGARKRARLQNGTDQPTHMGLPRSKAAVTEPAYPEEADVDDPNINAVADNYSQMFLGKGQAQATSHHAQHIQSFKLGFIGIGLMGAGIAGNLLAAGYNMSIWNRTKSKTKGLASRGATVCQSPADVVSKSDIIFLCLSDPHALRDVMIAKSGLKEKLDSTKSIVNFSTNDDTTAQFCSYHVKQKGGRYLEAPVWGSKAAAEGGTLIILSSGDKELYNDVEPCFQMIGKDRQYLGDDVGKACKFKLVLNMITGTVMCSLAEGLNLADKLGLSVHKTISILNQGALGCPLVRTKGNSIADGSFPSSFLLKHQQKDLKLALSLAEGVNAQTQVTATCNEIYKRAKALGYSDQDMSAVYKAIT